LCFYFLQCSESKQQLGPAVRVHVQGPGDNERKTRTNESLDFNQETCRRRKHRSVKTIIIIIITVTIIIINNTIIIL